MNKKEFIKALSKKINYSEEQCIMINEILESNFFISKKSKNKIIEELITKMSIDSEEAEKIYKSAMEIFTTEIKNKLKHPFRSID